MKTFLRVVLFTAAVAACAGMPNVEMPEAFVDKIEKTPAGWVATLTGAMTVAMADPKNPTGNGMLVTLYADKARVIVPIGNQLYALRLDGAGKYEQRLKNMAGQRTGVQIYGGMLTIEGGRVVQVIAGDVSLLRPQKGEAAFDIERLPEIGAK